MEDVLPNQEVRQYVQRACGYSLLGDADQRVMFLVWGPSGTGKSQFLETLKYVFHDYGISASLGAFTPATAKGPSPDVHRIRGKRFVSTSETADSARFDEECIKRLTGRDTMTTRGLYQNEVEWVPECTIWIATNHKPRFTSDDDAIWKRSKLLPFTTRFGDAGTPEIPDMARRFLFAEADGVLNWMLEGLRDFLVGGLREPAEIRSQVEQHRHEVDAVATFLDEMIDDLRLIRDDDAQISTRILYQLYTEWCGRGYEKPFGHRRFINRVQRYVPGSVNGHSGSSRFLTGLAIQRPEPGAWIIGR